MTDERTRWQKIELPAAGDRRIYLEVLERGGRQEVGILDAIPFEQMIELVGEIAQGVGNSLEKSKPTKAAIELGLEFGLENGQLVGLIARGSGKANLKICLEWERSEPKAGS